MLQSQHQESQIVHGAQLTELQADLKSLIEMEPYAHRARKLQASHIED